MAIPKQIIINEVEPSGTQIWLTTFNDLVTLLMVFFVLLFAMGSLDVKRFKHFQNALQSPMGALYSGKHAPIGMLSDQRMDTIDPQGHFKESHSNINRIEAFNDTQGLEAVYTAKGIQLTLNDNMLFTSGSAQVTKQGKMLLLKISKVIKPLKRHIRIEGHTDNVPIGTARYPSNWELSTERAINVVKLFINEGGISPHYLSAVGYGDVKPKTDNKFPLSRAKNRRVEIILGKVKETQTLK